MKKKISLVLTLFLFSISFVQAHTLVKSAPLETLVISDIDDTIKLSHILSKGGAVARAVDSDSWFYGINYLYQVLLQNNPSAKIAYLSAAPEVILESTHTKLLAKGNFPKGFYIARTQFISGKDHKLKAIRNLLNKYKPRKAILIGDNGERDSIVYNQITKEYKKQNIEFYTYIRFAYSKKNQKYAHKLNPIYPGQFLFVTPIEMAIELYKQKNLTQQTVQNLTEQLIDPILYEATDLRRGVLAFPEFVDCRGFKWPYATSDEALIPILDDQILIEKMDKLKEKVEYRCSLEMN